MAAKKKSAPQKRDPSSEQSNSRAARSERADKTAAAEKPRPAAELPRSHTGDGDSDAPAEPGAVDGELQADEQSQEEQAEPAKFPIVGIGASAGGLEALQEFFGHMPPDSGVGFVVVTHQHPGHVSMLPSLLAKGTTMSVVEAQEGARVEPNHVYVGSPGGLLTIHEGILRRQRIDLTRVPHLLIDHFFRSLAADQREHAICVVLSGTGTDGTLGMRAIKAESGMVMVQEPASAKYAGMPSSATATGLADYVLPAGAMATQLIAYVKGPYLRGRGPAVTAPVFPKEPLQRILLLLRTRTGHDFTCYKTTTIRRRIERRMNVHQIKEPQDYVRYLQENPHEVDLLFSELLISVTSFFRDPQAFEVLCDQGLPDLLMSRHEDQVVRVWVPGCASGEEAYSVAMVLEECMDRIKRRWDVQIFGTDLDQHAIAAARAGVYSGAITADVSAERLQRYFTREDNVYRIRKEVREMAVFALQNVTKDPPFTKLDLIVCRNLLIYLDVDQQRRLLPIFYYALRPGGLLFLGPSESISSFTDLFAPVDGKWKVYRRRETATAPHPLLAFPLEPPEKRPPQALPEGLVPQIRQTHTSTQVERLLGIEQAKAIGQRIYDVGQRQWDIPAIHQVLRGVVERDAMFVDQEVVHEDAQAGRRVLLMNARRLGRAADGLGMITLSLEDATAKKQQ